MDLNSITVADFKAQFPRDFPYSDVYDLNYIMDSDITRAFQEAQVNFNQGLFGTDAQIKLTYLYLTAHYLCVDIRNSKSGIMANGAYPVASRSVGGVSESYAIPEIFTRNPVYAIYSQTGYGMKYLSLVLPQLVGNIGTVCGGTNP